jgi:hypothetical protein
MFICCECCVLSGSLCDGLITRPEEPYRLWRLVVCDQETSKNEEAKARNWAVKNATQRVVTPGKQTKKQTNVNCYTYEAVRTDCTYFCYLNIRCKF